MCVREREQQREREEESERNLAHGLRRRGSALVVRGETEKAQQSDRERATHRERERHTHKQTHLAHGFRRRGRALVVRKRVANLRGLRARHKPTPNSTQANSTHPNAEIFFFQNAQPEIETWRTDSGVEAELWSFGSASRTWSRKNASVCISG